MDLQDKNVIYIGGFGGIGQKCLHELLTRRIKNLIIFDLIYNANLLNELSKTFRSTNIEYIKLDLINERNIADSYKETFEKIGHFDVVINGSGLMNDRLINQTIQINLLGVIHSTLTAMKYMDKSVGGRGGLIVNISSVLGVEPNGFFAIYSASKCGVTGFTRALADPLHYKRTGIGFITICPGFTDTSLLDMARGKETFDFPTQATDRFSLMKHQTAAECAMNLVKTVEMGKNGSVWMLDVGELKELHMPMVWKPTLKAQICRENLTAKN